MLSLISSGMLVRPRLQRPPPSSFSPMASPVCSTRQEKFSRVLEYLHSLAFTARGW